MKIDIEILRKAMREGQRVDGSGFVLTNKDGDPLDPAVRLGPILPPFEQAAFQTDNPHSRPEGMSLARFERLSMATRAAMANTDCVDIGLAASTGKGLADTFPIIDVDDLLKVIGEAIAYLELTGPFGATLPPTPDKRDNARTAALRSSLRAGVQIIGCRIIGAASIGAAGEFIPEQEVGRMRLANLSMPFSLRLVGCVIDSPIIANHCELQTLDLSGSSIAGLDASSVRAHGAVRLRRSTLLSPGNFGGAKITGVFDASDAVMQPRRGPPRGEAFAAERGMLNLGQAHFENDVYLNRVRIWGGLVLRGGVMERSLFLNAALIRCPVAVLERLGCESMRTLIDGWRGADGRPPLSGCPLQPQILTTIGTLLNDNRQMVEGLHPAPQPHLLGDASPDAAKSQSEDANDPFVDRESLRLAETIGIDQWNDENDVLNQLLGESMRARTSAIRGDGVIIRGNLFARRLKAMGRIRLNYAEIGSGLHLEGSRLRSVAAVGRVLDTFQPIADVLLAAPDEPFERPTAPGVTQGVAHPDLEIDRAAREAIATTLSHYATLRTNTLKRAQAAEHQKDDDFALDLQEASFGGSVVIGGHGRDARKRAVSTTTSESVTTERHQPFQPTKMDGVIAADRVRIGGDLVLVRLRVLFPPKTSYDDSWRDGPDIDRPAMAMNWELRAHLEARQDKDPEFGDESPSSIRLVNATIDGDLDLRESAGICGLNLENSRIEGSLLFADKMSLRPKSERYTRGRRVNPSYGSVGCGRRAESVCRDVVLRSAQIGGDAVLVFSWWAGPNIKAEFAKVGGRLDIYPQGPFQTDENLDRLETGEGLDRRTMRSRTGFKIAYENFLKRDFHARQRRWRLRRDARAAGEQATPPPSGRRFIDLRNAAAAVFCHPQPAWPLQGCLSIEGFSYERSNSRGPLAPHPFPLGRGLLGTRLANRMKFAPTMLAHYRVPTVVAGVVALLLVGLTVIYAPAAAAVAKGWALLRLIINEGDHAPLIAMGALALLLLALIALQQRKPTIRRSRPTAIAYLALQRSSYNRYKVPGDIYWSVDPYARAAKALREEGRAISANLVEAARLRHRTSMLSWRHHLLAKAGMLSVEWLADYGFNVSRTVTALAFVTILATMTANTAQTCHALSYENEKEGAAATVPPFEAFWYGASVVMPFFNLEDAKAWKPTKPVDVVGKPKAPEACKAWPDWLTSSWKPLFATLGLLLSTIAAVAIASRAESAFRRVEE